MSFPDNGWPILRAAREMYQANPRIWGCSTRNGGPQTHMNRRHGKIVRDIASRIGYENGDMDYVGSQIYDYFSDYNI